MDDVYHAADIYYLNMRSVDGDEKRVLENRMKWVLTVEEKYWKDSNAIGREAGVQKKIGDAQMRMLGKRRLTKRKGRGSRFKHRPDKKKTEKRKTLSNSKSDMEIDLVLNLNEASSSSDEEAEDVEMEGEDADGKYFNSHHHYFIGSSHK